MEHANSTIFESMEERQYVDFLDSNLYEYKQMSNYLRLGDIPNGEGWILYISVVYIDFLPLLKELLPVLQKQKAAAFLPRDPKVTMMILSGHLGSQHMGKVIGIIPVKGREIDLLLPMRQITTKYRGPQVHDCYHVGGNIYSAYYKLHNQDLFESKVDWLGSITMLDLLICQLPIESHFYKSSWPYGSAARMEVKILKHKRVSHGYLEQAVLKNDAKGKVSKVKSVLRMPMFKEYIIKEGKKHMSSDVKGRDIRDRLKWQYDIHKELWGIIPLPEAIEIFEANEDFGFVMEYIDGPSITDVIDSVYSYKGGWNDLDVASKEDLLKLLLQIVSIIETLHEHHYIHRDISSRNFIVKADGGVVCIDMELAYNTKSDFPNPPFVYGTPGYMSPEQKRVEKPTEAQDVYSIGALMFKIFTGLSPKLVSTDSTEEVQRAVDFLVDESYITDLICSCMAIEPVSRPTIAEVKANLVFYQSDIIKGRISKAHKQTFQLNNLQRVVSQGISGVGNPQMVNGEGLWVSKVSIGDSAVVNEQASLMPQLGLHTGIGGPLYLFLTAHNTGWDLQKYSVYIERNFNYLISSLISRRVALNDSLYHGLPGIAVLLQLGVNAGWLSPFAEMTESLQGITYVREGDLSVANGLAGQGLALLQLTSLMDSGQRQKILSEIIDRIVTAQELDGSWITSGNDTSGNGIKYLGFDYGISGIIYFLLKYYEAFREQEVLNAAVGGLQYMESVAIKTGNHLAWPVYAGAEQLDLWWAHGITGMCIPFIKAFEISSETKYKRITEEVLSNHLSRMVTPNWAVANGLAGLGHVYLNAYKAFGNEEWMNRATWIAGHFGNFSSRLDENSLSWIVDNSTVPTADLMLGSGSVVYYLLRCFLADKINYPIIN